MGTQKVWQIAPVFGHFTHRLNSNGTLDSTCRSCFVRVAAEVSAERLDEQESAHVCSPYLVERFRSLGGEREQSSS